jgi:CubicO group peptidase (beta-lactamase class C family)
MSIETRIQNRVALAIKNKVFPGCVIGIVRSDGTRMVLPYGQVTYEQHARAVYEDSLYDTASLTKSIPASSIALQLIDEGKLALTDKLIDYVPEFKNSDREHVLIKHLLTYTLDGYGFTSTLHQIHGKTLQQMSASDLHNLLLTHNFEKRPGTLFKYTNIPAALLGLVIETVTGDTLDHQAADRFFIPLGMNRTTFYPEQFPPEDIVPTERDEWRGLVHGVVHDESAYIFKKAGKIMGHAGLFSTAGDILNFLEMLLHNGTLKGKRYFSPHLVTQMGTNQIPELDDHTGLGWELNQSRFMGEHTSVHTFGKTGFTGTACVVDIEQGIAYVILSNRIYPQRPPDSSAINTFRAEIGTILLSP